MSAKDRWPDLLRSVEFDDGLPTRDCGRWTEEKLWLWNRYLEITTKAMGNNPRWREGLAYVDLFAGPGICKTRESGRRLPGSPILAARAPSAFRRVLLAELDPVLATACKQRVKKIAPARDVRMFSGDCNDLVDEIADQIPSRALTLAFIDPEGFDLRMSTLKTLAANRRVDFLLLFADAVDLVRNVDQYEKEPESKLTRAFGSDEIWKPAWEAQADRSGPKVRQLFSRLFAQEINRQLGYEGVREKIIKGPHGPLYRLLYASKHRRGLEFWDKVSARSIDGQQGLFQQG